MFVDMLTVVENQVERLKNTEIIYNTCNFEELSKRAMLKLFHLEATTCNFSNLQAQF
jgi:hypothetical protein